MVGTDKSSPRLEMQETNEQLIHTLKAAPTPGYAVDPKPLTSHPSWFQPVGGMCALMPGLQGAIFPVCLRGQFHRQPYDVSTLLSIGEHYHPPWGQIC